MLYFRKMRHVLWIIAVAVLIGLVVAGLLYRYRERRTDVMSGLLVVAIAAIAVVVTLVRVQEYREEQAKAAAANEALTASAAPPATAGPPPLTNAPPTPPVALPLMAPTVRGPTGGAAPPAAENPYAGSTR